MLHQLLAAAIGMSTDRKEFRSERERASVESASIIRCKQEKGVSSKREIGEAGYRVTVGKSGTK